MQPARSFPSLDIFQLIKKLFKVNYKKHVVPSVEDGALETFQKPRAGANQLSPGSTTLPKSITYKNHLETSALDNFNVYIKCLFLVPRSRTVYILSITGVQ